MSNNNNSNINENSMEDMINATNGEPVKKEEIKTTTTTTQGYETLDNVIENTNQESPSYQNTYTDDEDESKPSTRKTAAVVVPILALLAGGTWLLTRDKSNTTKITASTGTVITGTTNNTGIKAEEKKEEIVQGIVSESNKLGDYYTLNNDKIYFNDQVVEGADMGSFQDLGNKYAKDKYATYYQGKKMNNVESDKFNIIATNGSYALSGIMVNSDNLLNHLKVKSNREFLMTTIASVANNNVNVKGELTNASVYAMDKFKGDYNTLNSLRRKDDMTDLERAKFGVIFLYVKLMKNLENDQIRMSKAKAELKYFIQNSDEILSKYGPEQQKDLKIKGDIGYDEYCLYLNGQLHACFLNKIFIKKKLD